MLKTVTSIKIFILLLLILTVFAPFQVFAMGGKGQVGDHLRTHGKSSFHKHPHSPRTNLPGMSDPFNKHRPKPMFRPSLFVLLAEKYAADTVSEWKESIIEHRMLCAQIRLISSNHFKRRDTFKSYSIDFSLKLEANSSIRKKFKDAISANDTTMIQTHLTKQLKTIKNRNQLLKNKIAEWKAAK